MKAKGFLSNGTSNDSRSALRSEVHRAGDSPQPLREGARLQKRTGGTGSQRGCEQSPSVSTLQRRDCATFLYTMAQMEP